MAKLIFISGSTRKDSLNTKLAKLACEAAKEIGAVAKFIDLKDYDMPLYNGDLEAANGIPDAAKKLKQEFAAADGFFLANPEYNSSLSPVLLNALHWITRKDDGKGGEMIAFSGKAAVVGAASPSWRGGLRGLTPLKMMLGNIGVHVVPNELVITSAHTAFDDNGKFKEERNAKAVKDAVTALNSLADKLGK